MDREEVGKIRMKKDKLLLLYCREEYPMWVNWASASLLLKMSGNTSGLIYRHRMEEEDGSMIGSLSDYKEEADVRLLWKMVRLKIRGV